MYYASTARPSARYQLSSTGIPPCLQLERYCAVCQYWHETDFSTWAQVEIYNQLSSVPVPQKNLQYWHSAGISTAYHRRGFERELGWKLSIGIGAVLDIGTMPALKSVLVQYWNYSEVGSWPTLGLRAGAVLCQYRSTLSPVPSVQYRYSSLFTTGAVLCRLSILA